LIDVHPAVSIQQNITVVIDSAVINEKEMKAVVDVSLRKDKKLISTATAKKINNTEILKALLDHPEISNLKLDETSIAIGKRKP